MIKGERVLVRKISKLDSESFLKMVNQSQSFYEKWINPPDNEERFAELIVRNEFENFQSFVVLEYESNEIIGLFNLSQIARGNFQSAYLSYYTHANFARKGYMKEALELLLTFVFNDFGLHRLEANIQPENIASIALVKSCGFTKEGFSKKYLKINGIWSDHERWAITKEML